MVLLRTERFFSS